MEDELEGQYENGEGPNIRKLPLTVIANCIGGIISGRRERSGISPFLLELFLY